MDQIALSLLLLLSLSSQHFSIWLVPPPHAHTSVGQVCANTISLRLHVRSMFPSSPPHPQKHIGVFKASVHFSYIYKKKKHPQTFRQRSAFSFVSSFQLFPPFLISTLIFCTFCFSLHLCPPLCFDPSSCVRLHRLPLFTDTMPPIHFTSGDADGNFLKGTQGCTTLRSRGCRQN